MTNKSKLLKKSIAYKKLRESTEFERRYGKEKDYGKSIIKEQDLKEEVIKLQRKKDANK